MSAPLIANQNSVSGRCLVCEDDFETWDETIAHAREMRHRIERVASDDIANLPTSCYRCEPMAKIPMTLGNFFQHLEDAHGIARARTER